MRHLSLRLLPALSAGVLLFLVGARAHADVKPEDAEEAAAPFKHGKKLLEQGKPAEACPKFERSQHLAPGVGPLYSLADCYERVGLSNLKDRLELRKNRSLYSRIERRLAIGLMVADDTAQYVRCG